MANEVGQQFVGSKTITLAGTPEALTTREISCSSVWIKPKSANTGDIYFTDNTTPSQTIIIPEEGLTMPFQNPAKITIDASVTAEGVDWLAV